MTMLRSGDIARRAPRWRVGLVWDAHWWHRSAIAAIISSPNNSSLAPERQDGSRTTQADEAHASAQGAAAYQGQLGPTGRVPRHPVPAELQGVCRRLRLVALVR